MYNLNFLNSTALEVTSGRLLTLLTETRKSSVILLDNLISGSSLVVIACTVVFCVLSAALILKYKTLFSLKVDKMSRPRSRSPRYR